MVFRRVESRQVASLKPYSAFPVPLLRQHDDRDSIGIPDNQFGRCGFVVTCDGRVCRAILRFEESDRLTRHQILEDFCKFRPLLLIFEFVEFGYAQVVAALALAPGRDIKVLAALTLARCGDPARAKPMVQELEKSDPLNTVLKRYWLPVIRAAMELSQNNSQSTIEALQAVAPYELGQPPPFQPGTMYPTFLRGQAYLQAHKGAEAASEFQKILSHRGIVLNLPLGALAHLGLARASALSGDTAKAKTAYQDFFALWKNVDPDIPVLKEAKAEYAKLG